MLMLCLFFLFMPVRREEGTKNYALQDCCNKARPLPPLLATLGFQHALRRCWHVPCSHAAPGAPLRELHKIVTQQHQIWKLDAKQMQPYWPKSTQIMFLKVLEYNLASFMFSNTIPIYFLYWKVCLPNMNRYCTLARMLNKYSNRICDNDLIKICLSNFVWTTFLIYL